MNHYLVKAVLILLLSIGSTCGASAADQNQPATLTPFKLPMQSGKDATAQLLPVTSDRSYLVYATPEGELGIWVLTRSVDPIPPEPIPPIPPLPDKLNIAIVENPLTTTQAQRNVLASPGWREQANKNHTFVGIIPDNVKDDRTGKPPAHLLPFLVRAKTKTLPWVMFADDAGRIVFEGPLPATADELINLIPKPKRQKNVHTNNH